MTLVNIHKLVVFFILFTIGSQTTNAQNWSLQQCIDTAKANNKNLQIGRNNIAYGEQKAKEAKANLIPKLTANADYKYFTNLPYQFMPLSTFNPAAPDGQFKEAQFGVPHNINANLQLAIPLYSPNVYGAIATTKIATELTELQYQKTEEQLNYDISNLYYNAQILYNQLAFTDSNILNAASLLKNMVLLNEQLLAKGTDVSKVKLQLAQLNTQRESVNAKYEQVLNALKFAMGLSIDKRLTIETNIQNLTNNPDDPSISTFPTLELRMLKTQNRLLSNDLSTLNKSRFLPSLNLIGTYGTTGFGYDKQPNNFLKFYPIGFAGLQLNYPLFNGTVTQRKINQKNLEIQNNELQLGLVDDQNTMQIKNARLQRTVANKSVETTATQIDLAKTIYDQTILQQKMGTANLTDVLLADNALREAQQTYLAAIIEYLKAELELKKLTGQLTKNN